MLLGEFCRRRGSMFTSRPPIKPTPSGRQRSRLTFGNPSISPEPISTKTQEQINRVTTDLHTVFTDCNRSLIHLYAGENKNTSRKSHQRSEFYFFIHIVPQKGNRICCQASTWNTVATHLAIRSYDAAPFHPSHPWAHQDQAPLGTNGEEQIIIQIKHCILYTQCFLFLFLFMDLFILQS